MVVVVDVDVDVDVEDVVDVVLVLVVCVGCVIGDGASVEGGNVGSTSGSVTVGGSTWVGIGGAVVVG